MVTGSYIQLRDQDLCMIPSGSFFKLCDERCLSYPTDSVESSLFRALVVPELQDQTILVKLGSPGFEGKPQAEPHVAGVVCMNLKPSNFLLDANGHAVVSDYGLPAILKKPACRKAQCDSSGIHSCMDCTMLSPHYTAPEAWEPPVKKPLNIFWDDAIGISPESDAWSFGCTLVEMCTGSIPWAGLSAEEIYRAVVKSRRRPPQYAGVVGVGIPRELWKMIGECLQFKASKRPTFNVMLATFLRHLQEIPRSPPASPEDEFPRPPGTNVSEPAPAPLEVFQDNPNHLHQLVSEGDLNGVRDLLAKAASGGSSISIYSLFEAQNSDGQTALHLACRRGSAELVEAILEYREANVDVLDRDGDPPLVFALAAGSPECVQALIRRGANVRSRLREGFGPSVAHVCAFHGQPDCMCELLLARADPNAVDDEGESVLHRAIAKKYTDCALVPLENGGCEYMAVLNSKTLTPLHLCVTTWNVAVVRRWVEVASPEEIAEAIDIPSAVGTALCMAAALKKDHEIEGKELVRILLTAGADPTAQDVQYRRTALHTAAMANDVELVKVILDAGSLSVSLLEKLHSMNKKLGNQLAFSELLSRYSQRGYSEGKELNILILSDLYYYLQGELKGHKIDPGPFKEPAEYLLDSQFFTKLST